MPDDASHDGGGKRVYGPFRAYTRGRPTHGSSNPVYHTDPNCPRGKSIENPRSVNPDDREDLDECPWCAGEVEHAGGTAPLVEKLQEMEP